MSFIRYTKVTITSYKDSSLTTAISTRVIQSVGGKDDIRITFEVNRNSIGTPNQCQVVLYNLSGSLSRELESFIYPSNSFVGTPSNAPNTFTNLTLEAGYVYNASQYQNVVVQNGKTTYEYSNKSNSNNSAKIRTIGTIYTGKLLRVYTKILNNGKETATELLGRDAYYTSIENYNYTFPIGITYEEVLKTIAEQYKKYLGLNKVTINVDKSILEAKIKAPLNFDGLYGNELNNIANSLGAFVTIDNGELQIVSSTSLIYQDAVPYLSVETGLLMQPERTDNGLEVITTINPIYRINGLVQIDTSVPVLSLANPTPFGAGIQNLNFRVQLDTKGEYKIAGLSHKGDTYGSGASSFSSTLRLLNTFDRMLYSYYEVGRQSAGIAP